MEHFKVIGMTCNHCKMTVTKAIQALDPKAQVVIDLSQGKVDVETTVPRAKIALVIVDAGYEVN